MPEPIRKIDTIDVRADERFDEEKLAAYLRGRLPGSEGRLAVRQFGGGAANLTYLLEYFPSTDSGLAGAPVQYVLRRPPLGPVAASSHDMAREYKVLSVLWRAFPPAPHAYLFCDDPSVIGAPFFVMERREGVVARKSLPPEFAGMPDAPRRMSLALVDALAEFHAVDYGKLGLSDLGKPEGFIERQVEGWYRRWQAAKTAELPDMEDVYAWLKSHIPPSQGVSLVHNDYKLDNVMFAADDPGRITAIFDWDMCTLGDPLSDLAALLAYWVEPGDPREIQSVAMMPVDPGFPTRAELAERYAARSGCSLEPLPFYHALGLFRVAVIVAQIYVRFVRGQTQDRRFAALGPMIAVMARAACEAAAQ